MSTEPSTRVSAQELSAYFDDELMPEQAEAVARALEDDPGLRAEHAELGLLRGTVCAALEAEAQAVPAARFEQIWEQIDRAIERDARLQAEADRHASIWTRLRAALRPIRVPLLVAGAAAAVALIVVRPAADEPNNSEGVASVAPDAAPTPAPAPSVAPPVQPDRVAAGSPQAPSEPSTAPDPKLLPMPVPETSEAEIHDIEFGGRNGRISNTGTVTVLYVEEDETPTNSERSL